MIYYLMKELSINIQFGETFFVATSIYRWKDVFVFSVWSRQSSTFPLTMPILVFVYVDFLLKLIFFIIFHLSFHIYEYFILHISCVILCVLELLQISFFLFLYFQLFQFSLLMYVNELSLPTKPLKRNANWKLYSN